VGHPPARVFGMIKKVAKGLLIGGFFGIVLDAVWLFGYVVFELYWTGHGHKLSDWMEALGNVMVVIIPGASLVIGVFTSVKR
jgi:hypothetical protein